MFAEVTDEKGNTILLNVDMVPVILPGRQGEAVAVLPSGSTITLPLSYADVKEQLSAELEETD